MSIGGSCDKCGGHTFSGLHPLMPDAFNQSCKCNNTCICGGYIDDHGNWLGWRWFLACKCPLKAQRIAKRAQEEKADAEKRSKRAYLLSSSTMDISPWSRYPPS